LDRSAPATRLDKWLWHARFFRTRTAAGEAVADGAVRVNGQRVSKPAHGIRPGDTLTLVVGGRVRLIRVIGQAVRRGPAPVAQALYDDLDAPPAATPGDGPIDPASAGSA
jgi:ribosome-associated heat shock protein Hsp15